MKKKAAVFGLLGALAVGACPVSAADGTKEIPAAFRNIKVVVDGKELSTSAEPFIYNGTTYLPVRAVGEAVGMEVSWDESRNTVTLTTPPPTIETDGTAEGRTDFELSVTPSGKKERREILRIREKWEDGLMAYSLYYYGLSDVSVTIDGQTLPLADALQNGLLTPADIRQKGRQDVDAGKIRGGVYRDGGSTDYMYGDFTIIDFSTLTGIQDFYIGIPEIQLGTLEDEYYPYYEFRTIYEALDHFAAYANGSKPAQKQDNYELGLGVLEKIAKRDNLSANELGKAIQQYKEKCGMDAQ